MRDDSLNIVICGEAMTPDPLGALYWARKETLIVSDLHFEKGSSFASRGVMLPPYDTRTTLMRLTALIRRYEPKKVISLGDAFHDTDAESRFDPDDAAALEAMTEAAKWVWVLGNHDPAPPTRFQGEALTTFESGPLIFRHEPTPGAARGEISGHLHPCARVTSEGRSLRRRCFAVGECSPDDGGLDRDAGEGARIIMPALGAYTGGLNVLDDAYDGLFGAFVAWVMGQDGVYPIQKSRLAPDTPTIHGRLTGHERRLRS